MLATKLSNSNGNLAKYSHVQTTRRRNKIMHTKVALRHFSVLKFKSHIVML